MCVCVCVWGGGGGGGLMKPGKHCIDVPAVLDIDEFKLMNTYL